MSKMLFASSAHAIVDPFSCVDSPEASTLSIHYSIDSELASTFVVDSVDPFSFVDSPEASTLSIHYSIDSELASTLSIDAVEIHRSP